MVTEGLKLKSLCEMHVIKCRNKRETERECAMREVHQALRIIMDNDGRTADHLAEIDDSIVSLIARLGHPRPGYQVARSCGSNSFLLGFRVSTAEHIPSFDSNRIFHQIL